MKTAERKEFRKSAPVHSGQFMIIITLIALFLLSSTLPNYGSANESEVGLSRYSVYPGWGVGETEFLFILHVTSDESAVIQPEVIINNEPYTMIEMDPGDTNYSDGKNFYFRIELEPGGYAYFFRSGNTTTVSLPLSVTELDRIQYHLDIAIILSILAIPVIVMVLFIRRIERDIARMLEIIGKER